VRKQQAIGQAAIEHGYRVHYREAHKLLDELAEATLDGMRKPNRSAPLRARRYFAHLQP
jgi:hypothetical protein